MKRVFIFKRVVKNYITTFGGYYIFADNGEYVPARIRFSLTQLTRSLKGNEPLKIN